jgi:hypothetical protein
MATLNELLDLQTALQADPSDDAAFGSAVARGMELLALSDSEMAAEFDMSQPSSDRWRGGLAAPHPAIRKHVISFLQKKLAQLIAAPLNPHPIAP